MDLAHEHLAELMPIFDEIRARGECGNAYPLHVGSTAGPTLHMAHVNPNTCYWVRERSQRSMPMGTHPRTSKSSLSVGTPDSLSDNESSTFRTPRKPSYRSTLTPGGSRNNSRPASRTGSRPGSKPPSRHGSNLSLDSTDDSTPSRIPRRTPTSGRSATTLTATTRKNLNGSTSRPRTPTGLISPASPALRSTGISRASSIPTLTGISATPR
ncbi:hypothetical protein JTB14_037535 [Gonioctena quinquepunctata]|nr:hypothetical protein JTB14_037535 [Gonioctena quinquepunctata]